jgi:hypothetical protein
MAAKKPSTMSKQPAKIAKNRKLAIPKYQSFRINKRIRSPKPQPMGAFRLFGASLRHLKANWRLFTGIVLVYLVLTIVLVKGFGVSSSNVPEVKSTLQELFKGAGGQLTTGFTLFGLLLGTTGSVSSDVAGAYQTILLVIVSLVIIWALRQTMAGSKVGVKESFYKGLYPLIPFLLVLLVIGLQFIPLLVGNFLYSTVFGYGLAVTAAERVVWILIFGLLVLTTLYMVTSSIFALYIVTLPDVTPMQALRSARELVRHRRMAIARKVLFLPVSLLVIAAAIMIPVIIFLTPLSEWVFFLLSMAALTIIHSYMYTLYRELL